MRLTMTLLAVLAAVVAIAGINYETSEPDPCYDRDDTTVCVPGAPR